MVKESFRGWIANLDSGETIFETPWEKGKSTPWRQLLERLKKENLKITRMRLQMGGRTFHSTPRAEGYFQAREVHQAMFSGREKLYYGIGSILGNKVYIVWVNEQGDSWQDIRPVEMVKIHTTLG